MSSVPAFSRALLVLHSTSAFWKWLYSFRTRDWQLTDYPVFTREQEHDPEGTPERLRTPRCVAFIVNWNLVGTGDSRQKALLHLQENFQIAKAERQRKEVLMPRPGTRVPIEFASSERVDLHVGLRDDFIRRVLQLEWAFLSDESRLRDFHRDETNAALDERIREIYGVDVTDIDSGLICEILDRIAGIQESRQS